MNEVSAKEWQEALSKLSDISVLDTDTFYVAVCDSVRRYKESMEFRYSDFGKALKEKAKELRKGLERIAKIETSDIDHLKGETIEGDAINDIIDSAQKTLVELEFIDANLKQRTPHHRPTKDELDTLILDLATIFEIYTGQKPKATHNRHTASGSSQTPFSNFCMEIAYAADVPSADDVKGRVQIVLKQLNS